MAHIKYIPYKRDSKKNEICADLSRNIHLRFRILSALGDNPEDPMPGDMLRRCFNRVPRATAREKRQPDQSIRRL